MAAALARFGISRYFVAFPAARFGRLGNHVLHGGAKVVIGQSRRILGENCVRLQRQVIQRQMPGLEGHRSEEHTSELQSLMRISYAVFCLKKKKQINITLARKHVTS